MFNISSSCVNVLLRYLTISQSWHWSTSTIPPRRRTLKNFLIVLYILQDSKQCYIFLNKCEPVLVRTHNSAVLNIMISESSLDMIRFISLWWEDSKESRDTSAFRNYVDYYVSVSVLVSNKKLNKYKNTCLYGELHIINH